MKLRIHPWMRNHQESEQGARENVWDKNTHYHFNLARKLRQSNSSDSDGLMVSAVSDDMAIGQGSNLRELSRLFPRAQPLLHGWPKVLRLRIVAAR